MYQKIAVVDQATIMAVRATASLAPSSINIMPK
jgi:hypothetical protein